MLIRPDASPASACCTPASAAIEIGTKQSAIPSAMIRKPGSRSDAYEPSTGTCVKSMPTASSAIPPAISERTPTLFTRAAATFAQMIDVPATARYATPVFIAE